MLSKGYVIIGFNYSAFKNHFDFSVRRHIHAYVDREHIVYFLGVGVAMEQSLPVLPPLQLPVVPPTDTIGTPLSTPASPALSDDSDCLFRLDVDNVRSLLPHDITALPPVLKVVNEGTCSEFIHL